MKKKDKIQELLKKALKKDSQDKSGSSDQSKEELKEGIRRNGWLQEGGDFNSDPASMPAELKKLLNFDDTVKLQWKRMIQQEISKLTTLQIQSMEQQRDLQTMKVFKEIYEFSIGTYQYEERQANEIDGAESGVYKKFVPMFPLLFLSDQSSEFEPLDSVSPDSFGITNIECNFFHRHMKNTVIQNEDKLFYGMHLPSKLQIKFDVKNQNWMKSSREYHDQKRNSNIHSNRFSPIPRPRMFQCDINLNQYRSNINHSPLIYFKVHEKTNHQQKVIDDQEMTLIIELNVPATFFEGDTNSKEWRKIKSPLQLKNDLLNYWNLKQVIYIRGKRHDNQGVANLNEYLQKLVEQELIQSFKNNLPEDLDLSLVQLETDEDGQRQLPVEMKQRINGKMEALIKHGRLFEHKILDLAIPLRLSLMVPISNGRIQIFEPQIIELIEYLVKENFTTANQRQLQIDQATEFWRSPEPEKFLFKAYQIALEIAATQGSKLAVDRPLKPNELKEMLRQLIFQANENQTVTVAKIARESIRNMNRLPQRRIYLTPTIQRITPMHIEQSNSVLRELHNCIEYLARVSVMNDWFAEEFFNSDNTRHLLKTFIEPAIERITVCGVKFKFLNYSASQIKQKSWWDYVDNHQFGEQAGIQPDKSSLADLAFDSQSSLNYDLNSEPSSELKSLSSKSGGKVDLLIKLSKNREAFLQFIGEFNRDEQQLKQLARQGQSMSSSTLVQKVERHRVRLIKDQISNQFVFSDGSGLIAPSLMDEVAKIFEFGHVSAIQMRFEGFKGVLVSHPGLDSPLHNQQQPLIVFRESMKKFDGKLNELSVIRCSTFSPAYLNRQVILLLSNLGVDDQLFLNMNALAISNLDAKSTLDRLQRKALEIQSKFKKIKEQNDDAEATLELQKFMDELEVFFGPSRQFKNIFKRALLTSVKFKQPHGDSEMQIFNLDQEPIFSQIIHNMVLGSGQKLKQKARIPMKDAAVLIGVTDLDDRFDCIGDDQQPKVQLSNEIDYTQLLEEGEVFCQIEPHSFSLDYLSEETVKLERILSKEFKMAGALRKEVIDSFKGHKVRHIVGDVLITKNPCGHEGDIRPAKAIGKDHPAYPKLKHLVNVIVFSSKGERPMQNMMSGGDVDGDVYMVIWDKRIVQQAIKKDPFPKPSKTDNQKWKEECTEEMRKDIGIAESITAYFSKDMLGQVANLHLNLAIQKGLQFWATEKAAYLCSIQVDFAKHGRCIKQRIMDDLKREVAGKGKPLFLIDDEEDALVFETDHILEKLYEQVEIKNIFDQCMQVEHEFSIKHNYSINQFIISDFKEKLLNHVKLFKRLYIEFVLPMEQELISNLLVSFKLVNEGALFCSDFQYRFSDSNCQNFIGFLGKSNEDTINEIKTILEELIRRYRRKFKVFIREWSSIEFDKEYQNLKQSNQIESQDDFQKFLSRQEAVIAKSMYFASYFHPQNQHSQRILADLEILAEEKPEVRGAVEEFKEFARFKQAKIEERMLSMSSLGEMGGDKQQINQLIMEELMSFKKYKQVCKKAEANNLDRLNMLWSYKQLFSVPWLICYDHILI